MTMGEAIVQRWEQVEGEHMRDGHRHTMVRLIDMVLEGMRGGAPLSSFRKGRDRFENYGE